MSVDLKHISLSGVGLEPVEGEAADASKTGPAKFCANTRGKAERRETEDRRTEIRFEDNRRKNKDRRPIKSWEKGKNL
jgi:hypothetical protein